jgi:hypothetical protein
LKALLDSLVADWQARPTLRYGVLAIGAVLWLYGLLVASDAVRERDAAIQREARQIARMERDAQETVWVERATEAKALLSRQGVTVPEVETLGLAQAGLQDWLTGKARDAGLAGATITVTSGVEGGGTARDASRPAASAKPEQTVDITWLIRAQMRAEFRPLPMYEFLNLMHTADRRVWIENLTIRMQPTPRAELQIVAPYRQKKKAEKGGT